MKRKLGALSLAVVMSVSVFATACSKPSGDGAKSKITMGMTSAFKGVFNPIVYDDSYDNYILNNVFDSLWTQDEKLETTIPQLAESWKESDKKDSVEIKLRKDAKWSDGKPITADDYIFTWKAIANKDYTGSRLSYVDGIKGAKAYNEGKAQDIEGIKKIDDYTLKVDFEKSDARQISVKLWSTPIPKHIFDGKPLKGLENDAAVKQADKIVSSGPYKIKEIKANQFVVLEKRDDYYMKGKPQIKQIVWKVVQPDVAVGALQKGDIDFMSDITPTDFDTVKGFKNVEIQEGPGVVYQYLGMKTDTPKLKDKKVRQAITFAINRQALVDGLLKGHGSLLSQPVTPLSWAYNKELDSKFAYNPEKAKALLAEAGYKDVNGDGFVEDPQGQPYTLRLDFPKGNKTREQSAPIIAEDLKKVGLKIDLRQPTEFNTLSDNVEQNKGGIELWLMAWSLDTDPDPSGIWRSTDQWNFPKWVNAESDKLIEEGTYGATSFTKAGRVEVYKKWTELVAEEAPMVFLYAPNKMDAHNKRVKNVKFDFRGSMETPYFVDWTVE